MSLQKANAPTNPGRFHFKTSTDMFFFGDWFIFVLTADFAEREGNKGRRSCITSHVSTMATAKLI